VIGGLVDYRARRRFALDIGKDVFLTLFAGAAPQKYVRELEGVCRADKLCSGTQWTIDFGWVESEEIDILHRIVELNMSVQNEAKNISFRAWSEDELWVTHSVSESPGSRFLSYKSNIPGGEHSEPIDWDEETLKKLTTSNQDGSKTVHFDDETIRKLNVPPGGSHNYKTKAIVYQRSIGAIPLVTDCPVLGHTLTLSGSALKDLSVEVRLGITAIRPKAGNGSSTMPIYEIEGLTLAGTAILVQWQPKDPASSTQEPILPSHARWLLAVLRRSVKR
jgi:hypothetical protein